MLIINLPNIQVLVPAYNTLQIRELTTMVVLAWLVVAGKWKCKTLLVLCTVAMLYTLVVVGRSYSYDLALQLKLYVRMVSFLLVAVVVPSAVNNEKEVHLVFVYVLIMNALLALSGPLQEVTGSFTALYSFENWEFVNQRGGFSRYVSLLGDPNVGGMVGALLPLLILALPRNRKYSSVMGLLVFAIAGLLVSFSLSFTSLGLFLLCIVAIWLSLGRSRLVLLAFSVVLALTVPILLPDLLDRASETAKSYLGSDIKSQLLAPGVLPHTSAWLVDLDFRLFAYLDVNDTPGKILFGSTYDVVVPGSNYKEDAILAHNSFKEMYLAGGLIELGIYLVIFWITGRKAFRLLGSRTLRTSSLAGTAMGASLGFLLVLPVLFVFPVRHYPGIGLILWSFVAIVHVINDNFMLLTEAASLQGADVTSSSVQHVETSIA